MDEIQVKYQHSKGSSVSLVSKTYTGGAIKLETLTQWLKDRHQAGEEFPTSDFEFEFLLQTAPDYLLESYRSRLIDATGDPITDNDLSDIEWDILTTGYTEKHLESCWHLADVDGDREFCFTYLKAISSEREFISREQDFLEAWEPDFYLEHLKLKSQERELESSERELLKTSFPDFYLAHLKVKIDQRDLETDERKFLKEDDEGQSFYLSYLKKSVLNYGIDLLEEDQRSDLKELDDDFLYKMSSIGETVLESEHGFSAATPLDRDMANEILIRLITPDDSQAEEYNITVLGLPTEQTESEKLVSGLKQFFQWAYKNDAFTFNWGTAEAPARGFFETGRGDVSFLMSSDNSGCALVAFSLVNGNLHSRFKVFEPKVDQKSAFWLAVGSTVKENPGKLAMGALEIGLMVAPMGGILSEGAKSVEAAVKATTKFKRAASIAQQGLGVLSAVGNVIPQEEQQGLIGTFQAKKQSQEEENEHLRHMAEVTTIAKAEFIHKLISDWAEGVQFDPERFSADRQVKGIQRDILGMEIEIEDEVEPKQLAEPTAVESGADTLDTELIELIEDGAGLEMVTKRARRIGFTGDVEALFEQSSSSE